MNDERLIPIHQLSSHYNVEFSFLNDLNEIGLIEIHTIEQTQFIPIDKIKELEKIIRIHHELNVNMEGIDIVFNLLQKIGDLQNELNAAKTRLRLYENDLIV